MSGKWIFSEEIREQRNFVLGLSIVMNLSVCFSPLLLPPSVSEAGLQIGVATYQYLDREAFGGVNFPSYVLFTLRLFYWSTSVIFEFGLYLWMILNKEEKWSVPRSLHPGQSQFSQVSVTLKVQCKGIFLLVWTWTHLPKPPYPAAPLSLHAHLYKQCIISLHSWKIVPWDFKKGLCGIVPDT